MLLNDKRFLCYYCYATTIYQSRGKGNHIELPECVKLDVGELCPKEEMNIDYAI